MSSSAKGAVELDDLEIDAGQIQKKIEVRVLVEKAPKGKRLTQDYGHVNGRPEQSWADV
jgi:hypothetical protein